MRDIDQLLQSALQLLCVADLFLLVLLLQHTVEGWYNVPVDLRHLVSECP